MAAGFAIGVTVIGVAAILALLGILARHVGFWSWAWSRLLATKEEKAKLCRPEQHTVNTGGRPYLLDGEMDWINLWPRTGSYKRFFNLDDTSINEEMDPRMEALMHDFIPPQPLRPAPGPPARIPGYWDDDEPMEMNRQVYHSRYPPLERTDSGRSLMPRTRAPPYQRYEQDPFQPNGYHNNSTNPFKNEANYENYGNPFTYNYQPQYSFVEKENMLNSSLSNKTFRNDYIDNQSRNNRQFYDRNHFDKYATISPVHDLPSINNNRKPDHGYTSIKMPSTSQVAYDISLKQALLNQHKMEMDLHNKISQQRMIDRYDKIKKDEERIREEERVLNKLRYENDLIRRKQLQNMIQGRSPYHLAIKNYDSEDSELLQEQSTDYGSNRSINFERRFSGEDFNCDVISSSREYESDSYEINNYESNRTRDSPPPPAPDAESVVSQTNPQMKNEEIVRESNANMFNSNNLVKHEIPKTPPNTASLTPPNSAFSINLHVHRSSLTDPYSTNILHERLAQVEKLRTSELSNEMSNVKSIVSTSAQELSNPNSYSTKREMETKSQSSIHIDFKVDNLDDSNSDSNGKIIGRKGSLRRSDKRKEGSRRRKKKDRHRKSNEFNFTDVSDFSGSKDLNISPESSISPMEMKTVQTVMVVQNQDVTYNSLGNSQISAFNDVPSIMQENVNVNESKDSLQVDNKYNYDNSEYQINAPNCSLGNSPMNPRRLFLSYEGSSSWPNNLKENEVKQSVPNEVEDNASTKRVREYIASINARLQKMPESLDDNMQLPPQENQLVNTMHGNPFPVTPPSSAERTYSQSSVDTISSAGATWGSTNHWKLSSETPPSSAGLGTVHVGSKMSQYDTPPSSAGFYGQTPPNSTTSHIFNDTPPSSAGYSGPIPYNTENVGSFENITENYIETNVSTAHTNPPLRRAQSCESVSSDSSVSLGDLGDTSHQITGYLSVQVVYESETADLEVVVIEARDLIISDQNSGCDSYVRVFLLPDKSTNMQTRVFRHSKSPTYRERFLFALEEEEFSDRSLVFYMYTTDKFTNTLMGEANLKLSDVNLTSHNTIELPLTDMTLKGQGCGEIMFSLAYLPTAERLTVVVVKARNLLWSEGTMAADPFVKVYVLENGKKIFKKKTGVKKDTKCPLFNEAVIFNISSTSIQNIQLRITVAEYKGENTQPIPIGHVLVGSQTTGKSLSHWNQMMSSLRKPVGMWHSLRR